MSSLEGIDSRFRHAILAAKRAKQLVGGARKKIDMVAENPLTIAIEEIKQGKINFHILEEEAKKFTPEEEEVEMTEENKEENEIDRDLFFKTTKNAGYDEENEEDETDEDIDDIDEDDEDEDDEDDDDRDDYDDYDDDDDDNGIEYEEEEEED